VFCRWVVGRHKKAGIICKDHELDFFGHTQSRPSLQISRVASEYVGIARMASHRRNEFCLSRSVFVEQGEEST
jgi:hypothetical protein